MEDLALEYDKTLKEGQAFIAAHWRHLNTEIRHVLIDSGRWSQGGNALAQEEDQFSGGGDFVEKLESALGTIRRCVRAKLPYRTEAKAIIPGEALSDDVLHACAELLSEPKWHEPWFLRLALSSIGLHERANLMTRIPASPSKKSAAREAIWTYTKVAFFFLIGALALILTVSAPYLLGSALVEARRGDVGAVAGPLYALGLLWWIRNWGATKSETATSLEERTFDAWYALDSYPFQFQAIGEGALAHLHKMKSDGMAVPNIAFDVCAALRARCLYMASHPESPIPLPPPPHHAL